jgi:hypothetical protein
MYMYLILIFCLLLSKGFCCSSPESDDNYELQYKGKALQLVDEFIRTAPSCRSQGRWTECLKDLPIYDDMVVVEQGSASVEESARRTKRIQTQLLWYAKERLLTRIKLTPLYPPGTVLSWATQTLQPRRLETLVLQTVAGLRVSRLLIQNDASKVGQMLVKLLSFGRLALEYYGSLSAGSLIAADLDDHSAPPLTMEVLIQKHMVASKALGEGLRRASFSAMLLLQQMLHTQAPLMFVDPVIVREVNGMIGYDSGRLSDALSFKILWPLLQRRDLDKYLMRDANLEDVANLFPRIAYFHQTMYDQFTVYNVLSFLAWDVSFDFGQSHCQSPREHLVRLDTALMCIMQAWHFVQMLWPQMAPQGTLLATFKFVKWPIVRLIAVPSDCTVACMSSVRERDGELWLSVSDCCAPATIEEVKKCLTLISRTPFTPSSLAFLSALLSRR